MTTVTLYLDETLWREFRIRCIRRGISASKEIGKFMREQQESCPEPESQGEREQQKEMDL